MESPFSFKNLNLVQTIFLTAIMVMLASVAMSMVAILEAMQKSSDKIDKLVIAAMLENTSYDINIVEYYQETPKYFAIPLPGMDEVGALQEYDLERDLECGSSVCPDSVQVKLIRTVLNEQTILRDTMVRQ